MLEVRSCESFCTPFLTREITKMANSDKKVQSLAEPCVQGSGYGLSVSPGRTFFSVGLCIIILLDSVLIIIYTVIMLFVFAENDVFTEAEMNHSSSTNQVRSPSYSVPLLSWKHNISIF